MLFNLSFFLYSLEDVLSKLFLIENFFIPVKLLFYRGIVELVLIIILNVTFYFTMNFNPFYFLNKISQEK